MTAAEADNQPRRGKSRFGRKVMLVFFGVVFVFVLFKILLGSVFVYSEGIRTGYIYKFSKKGFVFKTYEGTLKTGFVSLGNTSTPNEEWAFSVKDEAVAQQINDVGERSVVKLHYKAYLTRLFWNGDTRYFVYKVEVLPPQH